MELARRLINEKYIVIPLAPGTKKPLVKWKDYQHHTPPASTMLEWFQKWPDAEPAILTGQLSDVMVLDVDDPYTSFKGVATNTPSGGKHYFYRYHEGDQHGLNVAPNIDIPYIVKVYIFPTINPGRIPIQGTSRLSDVETKPFKNISKTPKMTHIENCEFIQWFKDMRDTELEGRYPLARAYASNVNQCTNPDTSLGKNYRHTEQIYKYIDRPLRCSQIIKNYPCSYYNRFSKSCTKHSNVFSPYGLALKHKD